MLDTIVTGGQVVTPQGVVEVDIAIEDGRIAALAHPGVLPSEAAQVIDATGMIVLPGGIEPHTHIGIPVPEQWAGRPEVFTQPPEAATRAAAFGGVTTLLDFAGTLPVTPDDPVSTDPIMRQMEARRQAFAGHSYTDFAYHYILAGAVSPSTIGEIGEAIQAGQASFKIFTTFGGRVALRSPPGHLRRGGQTRRHHGGPR